MRRRRCRDANEFFIDSLFRGHRSCAAPRPDGPHRIQLYKTAALYCERLLWRQIRRPKFLAHRQAASLLWRLATEPRTPRSPVIDNGGFIAALARPPMMATHDYHRERARFPNFRCCNCELIATIVGNGSCFNEQSRMPLRNALGNNVSRLQESFRFGGNCCGRTDLSFWSGFKEASQAYINRSCR